MLEHPALLPQAASQSSGVAQATSSTYEVMIKWLIIGLELSIVTLCGVDSHGVFAFFERNNLSSDLLFQ